MSGFGSATVLAGMHPLRGGERGESGGHEMEGEKRVEEEADIDEGEGEGDEADAEDEVSMREAQGQCPDEEFSDLQGFAGDPPLPKTLFLYVPCRGSSLP